MHRGLGAAGLIERDGELAHLRAAVARAAAGEGSLVIVRGDAGIGKSRLCAATVAMARAAGMETLTARGGELESDVTYGVVRQLLERRVLLADQQERSALLAGQAALAGLTLGLAETGGRSAPGGDVDHGIFWLACNLAAARPLALIIDDAHWADEDSLRCALYLARRLEGLPVLLTLAARTGEQTRPTGRALGLLGAEPGARVLAPAPLSEPGSGQLMAERLGRPVPDELIHACHEVTGGTPFYLTEIAGTLAGDGAVDDAVISRVRTLAPPAVSHSVLLRLGRLSPTVQTTAAALAVLGEDASTQSVAATAQLDVDTTLDALEQLARAGIGAPEAAAPALAHPIIRAAIYLDLPVARRAALHGAAARALLRAGAAPEQAAHHAAIAEPAADPAAVTLLRRAAERALTQGAAPAAVRLLARARREPPPPGEVPSVLVELGEAELAAGELAAAAGHLRDVLTREPAGDLRVRAAVGAARALAPTEGFPAALAVLAATEAQARAGGDARLDAEQRLALRVEHAALSLYLTDAAAESQRRIRELAALPGDTPTERLALALAALACGFDPAASAADAVPIAARALGDGALVAEQGADSPPFGNACYVLVFAERYRELERQFELAFADARSRGSAFGFATVSLGGLMLGLLRGELTEAIGHAEALRDCAAGLGDTPVVRRWVSSGARFGVEALIGRGHGQRARELLAPLLAGGDLDSAERGMLRYARALVSELDGDPEGAHADFSAYGEICRIAGYEDRTTPWRLGAARALAALGRRDEALAMADEAVAVAARWGTPGGLGAAQRTRALVGDPEHAVAGLTAAVATLEGSEHRLEIAGALVDLGFALRARGRRTDARARLEAGLELAARCEADALVARARDELRALGARPRRLMFSGVEALTASERRVAAMAGQGLSNRDIAQALFVTQKTVETHLRNVYRKLDIGSRRQLPERLAAARA
jgi:DNA-binding CsgD family transcriptional regulator